MLSNYTKGHLYEKIALWYLILKGYKKIALNYQGFKKTGIGEIDLIMQKKKTIVFVEVKFRDSFASAAESIKVNQQIAITKASALFLKKNPKFLQYSVRYDAIIFQKHKLLPKHIVNAWSVL